MAADIFGQRLDGHVHAMGEGLEMVDAPGVVHQHLGAVSARDLGQAGDILHVEGVAARRFDEQNCGVGLE